MDEEQQPEDTSIHPVEPEIDLAESEGFPAYEHIDPPQMKPVFDHTSDTVYWFDSAMSTRHDVLLEIKPGENRWPDADEATIEALQACVEAGVLTVGIPEEMAESHVDDEDVEPDADDEDTQAHEYEEHQPL